MPKSLKYRLSRETYWNTFDGHPLFCMCNEVSTQDMTRMCHLAISELLYSPMDDVFMENTRATACLFVAAGQLGYCSNLLYDQVPVADKEWISEAAIWGSRSTGADSGRTPRPTSSPLTRRCSWR